MGVEAIQEFVKVVEPFQEATGFKKKEDVVVNDPNAPSGLADAIAQWVAIMPEVADKMDPVIEKVDNVGTELEKVDAKRYPENFRGVAIRSNILAAQQYLTQASEYGPDIKSALVIIPSLLGVGTAEKRYAIIMQNNVELRATGGFWTNYATFKIKDAKLNSDFSSKDMYSLDEIIGTTDTAWTSPWKPPFPPYKQFLKTEHTYARDANFSPDYITAVDEWMWYYKKVGTIVPAEAKPINGVFAIDTEVVKKLLEVTGPVTVGGYTYDSNNVVLELEKQASLTLKEQQGRKRVLGDLMEEMLINMYKSESNLWPKFIETALNLAVEKHVLMYVFDDPKGQALLEKYNFAGRIFPYDKGDFSYIVSSNLGGDKTNLFITKDVVHNVAQENGKWIHDVSINYTYNPIPAGWEPLRATYRDWVRVYAPAGSTLISIDGSEATTESDKGEERGKVYFAGYTTVEPDSKKTIRFKYQIPDSLVTDKSYNIYLQKQPGTFTDKHTVNIKGKTQSAELKLDKELKFTF